METNALGSKGKRGQLPGEVTARKKAPTTRKAIIPAALFPPTGIQFVLGLRSRVGSRAEVLSE